MRPSLRVPRTFPYCGQNYPLSGGHSGRNRCLPRIGSDGFSGRRDRLAGREMRTGQPVCRGAAYGAHETALGRRCARYDDRCHDDLWGRFVCRPSGLSLPRLNRHYVLHIGGLFWECEHKEHPECGESGTVGRPCRNTGRHIHRLSVLRIIFI